LKLVVMELELGQEHQLVGFFLFFWILFSLRW
jgi:hypothetical protein